MSRDGQGRLHVAVLGIKRLPALAGADRVVEHLLDRASPQNTYTVYLVKDGAPPLLCTSTRKYVYIPALKGKYLRAPCYFLLCCLHLLLKGDYDVAHVHNSDFGLFCPLLKLKPGVRVVGTFHGDPSTRDKWSRAAKAFFRISEAVFVRTCDVLTSVSPEKVVTGRTVQYIPNGVEENPGRHAASARQLPVDLQFRGREYLMFACGRLDRTKGLHHLLEAYRSLVTDAPLLVVGDFSHDAHYSAQIEREVVADKRVVLHKELLDKHSLCDLMRSCRLFVFPSEVEGMSMMLLEAVNHARIVVCSDIAANLAVVGAEYPFRFRSRDCSSLRAVLEEALAPSSPEWDPGELRDCIGSTFSWRGIVAEYETLYAQMAHGRVPDGSGAANLYRAAGGRCC